MLRESLRSHLITMPEIEVVGEAADGEVAVMEILRTVPDCVLLDLELPVMDGFEVMEAVRPELPHVKFLILSGHCSIYTVHQVRKAGVAGFIDKADSGLGILRTALREIAEGRTYFCDRFRDVAATARVGAGAFIPVLTQREQQILTYIAGANSKETIARNTGLSVFTVVKHRNNLLRKLGMPSTLQLTIFAIASGFKPMRLPRAGPGAKMSPPAPPTPAEKSLSRPSLIILARPPWQVMRSRPARQIAP